MGLRTELATKPKCQQPCLLCLLPLLLLHLHKPSLQSPLLTTRLLPLLQSNKWWSCWPSLLPLLSCLSRLGIRSTSPRSMLVLSALSTTIYGNLLLVHCVFHPG